MVTFFTVVQYFFIGVFGLVVLLVIYGYATGNRIEKEWEYEADFRNDKNREFGEFEIERSRNVKTEPEFSFKSKFKMRHESLTQFSKIQIYLEEILVLEGVVSSPGHAFLGMDAIQNEVDSPQAGQICRVLCDGKELVSQAIHLD